MQDLAAHLLYNEDGICFLYVVYIVPNLDPSEPLGLFADADNSGMGYRLGD